MKYKLTIQEKLKDLRIEKGLSLEQLANATGISKSALASYESDNGREIGSYNLSLLAKFYGVSADYLLGLRETRRPSPLSTDSLRISDDAIKILRDRKFNPLLLSEILTNGNFMRLMIDAEIYVDGNVTTQFHTLNKMLDAERMIFVKKLLPSDYDLQMETMRKISIDENAFFEHTLSEDIVRIMREIRTTHLGDIESHADTSIVDRMVATIDEVAGFKGTSLQKFKLIFQKWFGTKRLNLPSDTDKQLETALNSELLKPAKPQKKKHM